MMNTKKIIFSLAFTILTYFCLAQGTGTNGYTISGKIDGLTASAGNIKGINFSDGYIYLSGIVEDGEMVIDSVKMSNGKFEFKGKTDEPTRVYIICKPTDYESYVFCDFFLDNYNMLIDGKYDQTEHAIIDLVVKGSTLEDEYNKLQRDADTYSEMSAARMAYKDASEKNDTELLLSLQQKIGECNLKNKEFIDQYICSHPESFLSLYYICNSQAAASLTYITEIDELNGLEKQLNSLSPKMRKTTYARNMFERIDTMKKSLLLSPGKAALDFEQPDIDGNIVRLSDYKGKYLLIDFWASWCGGCRAENPNVLKAYNKYHDKGLEILSISMDKSKTAWMKAVQDDKLPWKQVSDLKGWENTAGSSYMIQAIPENFLIDPNGIIVAKSLRGEGMEKKLSEIFK